MERVRSTEAHPSRPAGQVYSLPGAKAHNHATQGWVEILPTVPAPEAAPPAPEPEPEQPGGDPAHDEED